jgi:excisionase family DNA binding protein
MNQHTNSHDDVPLNIEDAAHRLGVSVRYMRRMIDEKRVRYLKVGRLVRFRGPDLAAFLKQAEVEPVGRLSVMSEPSDD